eukprot:32479-Eustigmatos_ZCMA.PRE.1
MELPDLGPRSERDVMNFEVCVPAHPETCYLVPCFCISWIETGMFIAKDMQDVPVFDLQP